jgi:sugar (pentulose or hexulose) kinase
MSTPTIAIFDIGKTNQKLFLFDEAYKIVFEKTVQLPEIKDEDGFPCEDIEALTVWVKNSMKELFAWPEFEIKALNVSAHGAGLVHIDDSGKPIAPFYNYLKPYPEDLKKKFYSFYGGEDEFARITASPVLENLNSGMQLYWIKHARPELFKRIKYSLHLPEYFSFLFTHVAASGITSIGCHTHLWDFARNDYHEWVTREGIISKLAPIRASTKAIRCEFGNQSFHAGTGLHDSSAALIPYLQKFFEPFVLLSTGTWNISLNPFNHSPLTAEELNSDCLCYLRLDGKPVKASRLFAGYQHDEKVKKLAEHYHIGPDFFQHVPFHPEFCSNSILNFSDLPPTCEEAYHRLMAELVCQQKSSTDRIIQKGVANIFVDGGFSKNPVFMNLLSRAYRDQSIKVYAAELHQASALGAALVIHEWWNSKTKPGQLINLNLIE